MTDARHTFTDAQWQRIEPSMPPCKGRPGGAYSISLYTTRGTIPSKKKLKENDGLGSD